MAFVEKNCLTKGWTPTRGMAMPSLLFLILMGYSVTTAFCAVPEALPETASQLSTSPPHPPLTPALILRGLLLNNFLPAISFQGLLLEGNQPVTLIINKNKWFHPLNKSGKYFHHQSVLHADPIHFSHCVSVTFYLKIVMCFYFFFPSFPHCSSFISLLFPRLLAFLPSFLPSFIFFVLKVDHVTKAIRRAEQRFYKLSSSIAGTSCHCTSAWTCSGERLNLKFNLLA